MCLISSSCHRTTSLPYSSPTLVHCNTCGSKKTKIVLFSVLVSQKLGRNTTLSFPSGAGSAATDYSSQDKRQGTPSSNSSVCSYSLTQCLWPKPPGKAGSGPVLRPLWRMGSTWGTVVFLARRACNVGHDIHSSQQTLDKHIHNSPAPFLQMLGGRWGRHFSCSAKE